MAVSPSPFASAREIAAAIARRETTAREMLELYAERVGRFNPSINAIVETQWESAREHADAADRAVSAGGVLGPLHGVPITVKESFRVEGMRITWGHPKFEGTVSQETAPTVKRLTDAGAVLFGKSNVPYLLGDWQTYNAIYGATNNPWDLSRSPGGSSGGAAAALAAGLTGLEMGTDIGASIRNPAHYCGVYGHKPTYGIVTQFGHALPGSFAAPDLGVVGPMARSAEDLDLALTLLGGHDAIDAQGWTLNLPAARHSHLRDFRIAVLEEAPQCPVDQATADRFSALIAHLRAEGAQVDVGAWPEDAPLDEMYRMYLHLLRAAVSRNYTTAQVEQFRQEVGPKPTRDGDYWTTTREGISMMHRDWLMINELRHRLRHRWARFFQSYDVVIAPVAATGAMPHDESEPRHLRKILVDDVEASSIDQLFYAGIATVAYLPSTAFPIGQSPSGLPIGAQIIGPQYGDRTTIALAALIAQGFGGFMPPPGF